MNDDATRTRFLSAIAAQLPIDRVVEVHLFGSIRQGGAESGVAVIAVDPGEPRLLDVDPDESRPSARRYTVFTGRYRLTLKGPDRGKWEASVTEEADAPLLTVDAVVRGVARRSGEADETVRISGEEFRAALPVPAPTGPSGSRGLPATALRG
jgi:hypothetical protein